MHDLGKRKLIKYENCKFFVIDECDKVLGNLDMRSKIDDILAACSPKKQLMLFSATLPESVRMGKLNSI